MFERRIVPPYGLRGGDDGAPFRVHRIAADGRKTELPGKINMRLDRDDRIVMQSSGGGGYGKMKKKSRETKT